MGILFYIFNGLSNIMNLQESREKGDTEPPAGIMRRFLPRLREWRRETDDAEVPAALCWAPGKSGPVVAGDRCPAVLLPGIYRLPSTGVAFGNGLPGVTGTFNLLRYYAVASLISVLVVAVLLAAFYRHVEVQEGVELARGSHLALAESVLNSVRPGLVNYLESVTNFGPRGVSRADFPASLASVIRRIMDDDASAIVVRIYNNRGIVVFSTQSGQVGWIDSDKSGFITAISGKVGSDFTYPDLFSRFDQAKQDDNLMQTFIPVRGNRAGAILGVLMIGADLGPPAARNEREFFTAIAGIVAILAVLYSVLFFIVLRARKVIERQQKTIRDRTLTLEAFYVQLLAGEETEKEKLATGLHEGFARTLSAIKVRIEDGLDRIAANMSWGESLRPAVLALQGVIEEVKETAMELRPPTLDELGLLPTIQWFCREFEYLHPDIRIDQQISVQEAEIPGPLKIVIYRIIETAIKDISQDADIDRIRLALRSTGKTITLSIDDIPRDLDCVTAAPSGSVVNPSVRFAAAQERTTLSGGVFSTAKNEEGGTTLHACWAM